MKKKIFAIFLFALFSIVGLSACNNGPKVSAYFNREEYILSKDEGINFFDELNIKGGNKEEVTFSLSNSQILEKGENTFVAKEEGETIVFVNYKDRVLSSCKVLVKYRLSTPKNFILNQEGVYSWDKSFTVVKGEKIYADRYEIGYRSIENNLDDNEENLTYLTITENQYNFENGNYLVKIRALSSNEYLQESKWSKESISVGTMGYLQDVELNIDTYSQSAGLKWKEKDALYDIYVEDIKVLGDYEGNNFTYDFSRFENLAKIKLDIIAKDKNSVILDSKTTIILNKLASPLEESVRYNFNSNNKSYISWEGVENSFGYSIDYQNSENQGQVIVKKGNEDYQDFEGVLAGAYQTQIMSLGGKNEKGEFFINSNKARIFNVAKLEKPSVSITLEDNKTAKLNFDKQYYTNLYQVSYAGRQEIFDTTNESEFLVDVSDLNAGDYTFEIIALANQISDGKVYIQNGIECDVVMNSDNFEFNFHILEQITTTHKLLDNTSIFTFNYPFNFNQISDNVYYEVFINDLKLQKNSDYLLSESEGKVVVRIDSLKNYLPIDIENGKINKGYKVKMQAGVKDSLENKKAFVSTSEINVFILDKTSEGEYENTSFAWNEVTPESLYQYKIYKTESDYVKGDILFSSQPQSQTQINEVLEFGYYVIEVTTISINDNYLDSDFYSNANIFTKNFYVTKEIEIPNVEYVIENNSLNIIPVEFGGEYVIYIDEDYLNPDGIAFLKAEDFENKEKLLYQFKNKFIENKTYKIEVVATSGREYDSTLHTPSQKQTLFIVKLDDSEFEVVEEFNRYGEKIKEKLLVKLVENSTNIQFKLDGVLIDESKVIKNGDSNSLDLSEYSLFGRSFNLSMVNKAKDSEENYYYLDSNPVTIDFKRIASPKNIRFSNNIISFESEDVNIASKYRFTINLSTINGTYPKVIEFNKDEFIINGTILSIDLQEVIDGLLENDSEFSSLYRISSFIELSIDAFKNSYNDEATIYYLPSQKGTTLAGENNLKLSKLSKVNLTVDVENNRLLWNEGEENTRYDIFVGDKKVVENYSSLAENSIISIRLSDMKETFSEMKDVYIKAVNENYLDSDNSNIVKIKQLAKIKSVNIVSRNDEYFASVSILNDATKVEEILVNGNKIDFTSGEDSAIFEIGTTKNFTLQLKAKNSGEEYYYLNSDQTSFEIDFLNEKTLSGNVNENDYLIWNTIVNDFSGNDLDPIIYTLRIKDVDGKIYTISTTQIQFALQQIESEINAVLSSGIIEITIEGRVAKDYTLSLEGKAKGYTGKQVSSVIEVEKLKSIENISHFVSDNETGNEFDKKLNSFVNLSFEDIWKEYDGGISFIVAFEYEDGTDDTITINQGTINENYSMVKEGDFYNLRLNKDMIKEGINKISFVTCHSGKINSSPKEYEIKRYHKVKNAFVQGDGNLVIEDEQNGNFIIELTANNKIFVRKISANKLYLLGEEGQLLDGVEGEYSIKILAYEEGDKSVILPSSESFEVVGYKLKGIEEVKVDERGNIVLTLPLDNYEGIEWSAKEKLTGKELENINVYREENSNKFYLPVLELLQLFNENGLELNEREYNFSFTVKKKSSVNADWKEVSFEYKVGDKGELKRENLSSDYIIFSREDDLTTYFRVTYTNKLTDEKVFKYFSKEETLGFWKTYKGENIGFTKGDIISDDEGYLENGEYVYTPCYAINVNELSAEQEYGYFEIQISRICSNGNIIQNSNNIFNFYKLNAVVEGIRISNNTLSWTWSNVDGERATSFYLKFTKQNSEEFIIKESFISSFDLTQVLESGNNYQIEIIALSSKNNVIASNPSNLIEATRYPVTPKLEIVNGKIVFNVQDMKESSLISDIQEYFLEAVSDEQLFNILGSKSYLSPYQFNLDNFENATVKLKFIPQDEGIKESEPYYLTIKGYELFPNFEIKQLNTEGQEITVNYIDRLVTYAEGLSDGINQNKVKTFASLLKNSNRGIGDDNLLFDDIGRQIPGGRYKVTIVQTGGVNNVESEESEVTYMYLTSSPDYKLDSEVVDDRVMYKAIISPCFTQEEGINKEVTRYKMLLRFENEILSFFIEKQGEEWMISYHDKNGEIFELSNVVTKTDNKFEINFTALRKECNNLLKDGENNPIKIIRENCQIKVDIFAYFGASLSSENDIHVHGKSAKFNINYLDLDVNNLSFKNGVLKVRGLEKYQIMVSTSQHTTPLYFTILNGEATIELDRTGRYDYIRLSYNGSKEYNFMDIGSDIYEIRNVVKLTSPSMSTYNNMLRITYNSNDYNYAESMENSTLQFNLASDISEDKFSSNEISNKYYYSSQLERNKTLYYTVGNYENFNEYELTASNFKSYLNGNSGTFKVVENENKNNADYTLEFSQTYMLFSSTEASLTAKMISSENMRINIVGGNIVWENDETENEFVGDGEREGVIVYQIVIDYYNEEKTKDDNGNINSNYDFKLQEIYYTTEKEFNSDYISTNYDYYVFTISMFAGLYSDESEFNAIKTLEDEYFITSARIYYKTSTLGEVLKGKATVLGRPTAPIGRSQTPYLEEGNVGINKGKVTFRITKPENYTSDKAQEVIRSLSIFSEYGNNRVKVEGEYSIFYNESSGQDGYLTITFIPNAGQLEGLNAFNLKVYRYEEGELRSKPLEINNVYKLNALSSSLYTIEVDSLGRTIIDFRKYFDRVSILNSNNCYEIRILSLNSDKETQEHLLSANTTTRFVVDKGYTKLDVQAVDSQNDTTVESSYRKILNSDILSLEVNNYSNEDVITIEWNDEEFRFEWNFAEEKSEEYEYYVEVSISDNSGRRINESGYTQNNFFIPHTLGTISSGNFKLRARKILEGKLCTFSDNFVYDKKDISTNSLFEGGNGSQNSPYLISNKLHFFNIAKRNQEGIYFKLNSDLIDTNALNVTDFYKEGNLLIKRFYGKLDGNNKKVSIICDTAIDFEGYNASLSNISNTLKFDRYSSIFESIDSSAEISKLNISYTINYNKLNGENILISPLALYNYGTISNVNVEEFNYRILTGGGDNHVLVGGIVSLNYGSILHSSNNASFEISMAQRLSLNLGYSGIAIFNNSSSTFRGQIKNCFNAGDKSVRVTTEGNVIYLSGIAYNNYATISTSGNDGNMFVNSVVSNCAIYMGGIVVKNIQGNLEYLYNNGSLSKGNNGSLYAGGIAYTLNGGSINTLVDTTRIEIIKSGIPSSSSGKHYSNYSGATIPTTSLSQQSISCGSNRLRIEVSGDNFRAYIV